MNTFKLFSLSAVVLLASACGKPGTVQGKISDNNGSQARSLGGAGTIAAAASAQLSIVNDDGSLQVIGEAAVSADGSYSIESETLGEGKLVVYEAGAAAPGQGAPIRQPRNLRWCGRHRPKIVGRASAECALLSSCCRR